MDPVEYTDPTELIPFKEKDCFMIKKKRETIKTFMHIDPHNTNYIIFTNGWIITEDDLLQLMNENPDNYKMIGRNRTGEEDC